MEKYLCSIFWKLKIYLGVNILLDEEVEVLKDTDNNGMGMGCNKTVNAHNDLRFSDAGVQSMDDSADP